MVKGPILLICITFSFLSAASEVNPPKWESIFNGQDLTGWVPKIKGYKAGDDPKHTFTVKNGAIAVDYSHYRTFDNTFGHLFYNKPLSNYRLRLEYRFIGEQLPDAPGWAYKNSGVMLQSQAPQSMQVDQDFPVSIEGQFLGADENAKHRPTANLCTPATVVSVDGNTIKPHCTNSRSESYPGEQWVKAEFVVNGSQSIEHWINGKQIYEYHNLRLDKSDPQAKKLMAAGQPVSLSTGYIALQSESHPVEFRNIELMILE